MIDLYSIDICLPVLEKIIKWNCNISHEVSGVFFCYLVSDSGIISLCFLCLNQFSLWPRNVKKSEKNKYNLVYGRLIIIIFINPCREHGRFLLSFSIRPHLSSLFASPLSDIQCPHRAEEWNFLLIGHKWCVHI